jgi:NitT/TauT family transport system substrate-binding protein
MRRSAFIAASAAMVVHARAAAAQSPDVIRIASAPDEDVIASLWAADSGAFRNAGLDVSIQKANSGAAVAAAVAGGSIEIGKSSLVALITAHVKGLPFVVVAPAGMYDTAAPTVGLIVAKDSPLKSGADLNGKTLSASSLGDQNSIAMQAWIDQHGGDSKTVKFVELPSAAAPDAIAAGRVDAATLGNPILSEAVTSGKCRILGRPFDAIAPHFLFAGYFCTADYAARNKDAVARFRHVMADSANYVNRHHAQTVDVVSRFTGIAPAVVGTMTRTPVGATLDPKMIQPLIEIAFKYKVIPAAFDARTLIYE